MTICPKCNTPLKKGQVYCGKCGNELQFVADFEPEIEESIQEVLTNIVEEISEDGISNDWISEDSITITIGYHNVEEAPFELLDYENPKNQKQKSTFHIFKTFMISLLGIFGAIFIYNGTSHHGNTKKSRTRRDDFEVRLYSLCLNDK